MKRYRSIRLSTDVKKEEPKPEEELQEGDGSPWRS